MKLAVKTTTSYRATLTRIRQRSESVRHKSPGSDYGANDPRPSDGWAVSNLADWRYRTIRMARGRTSPSQVRRREIYALRVPVSSAPRPRQPLSSAPKTTFGVSVALPTCTECVGLRVSDSDER